MDCLKTILNIYLYFFLLFPLASKPKWKSTPSLCLPLVHANTLKGERHEP